MGVIVEDKTSSKDVQKRAKPTELDLLIDIEAGLNASKIAKKYGFSKASVSNWLKFPKEKGLIENTGYGLWELTSKGSEQVQKYQDGIAKQPKEGEFFYDDVQITYPIELIGVSPFKDGQWNLNKFTSFSLLKFGEWTVRNNNNKSLTIIFPKVYGRDENEPISKVYYWSHQLIEEIQAKYPQIKVLSKIPKLTKAGSLGSTKLNELLAPTLKHVTIRSKDYDADSTPKPAIEFKVIDTPQTAARKLKDTLDFISEGGYKRNLEQLAETLQGIKQHWDIHLPLMQKTDATLTIMQKTFEDIANTLEEMKENLREKR